MCKIINYEKLPFVSISKENLQLIYDTLEPNQAGNVILALYPYLYEGIEPNFETKAERGAWNQILAVITRKGEGLLEQIEGGEKGAEAGIKGKEFGKLGGRPRKGETKEEYKARKEAEMEPSTDEEAQSTIEPEKAPETAEKMLPETEAVLNNYPAEYKQAVDTDNWGFKRKIVSKVTGDCTTADKVIVQLDRYYITE